MSKLAKYVASSVDLKNLAIEQFWSYGSETLTIKLLIEFKSQVVICIHVLASLFGSWTVRYFIYKLVGLWSPRSLA